MATALNQSLAATPTTPTNVGPASPTGATALPASVVSAAQAIFAADPTQQAVFQNQYQGNMQAWLQSFTQWWSNFGSQLSGQMANYGPEANLLSALGYSQGSNGNFVAGPNALVQPAPLTAAQQAASTTNQPAEESLYNESIGGLNQEVLNDQNLATDTANLQNQNIANYGTLEGVLGSSIAPPGGTSAVTQQENTAAQTAAASQIASLQQSIATMSTSLSGSLAAQAVALQNQLNQVQQNIGQYGSAATQALMDQINTQLGDLQTSIQSQQGALQTQIQHFPERPTPPPNSSLPRSRLNFSS